MQESTELETDVFILSCVFPRHCYLSIFNGFYKNKTKNEAKKKNWTKNWIKELFSPEIHLQLLFFLDMVPSSLVTS